MEFLNDVAREPPRHDPAGAGYGPGTVNSTRRVVGVSEPDSTYLAPRPKPPNWSERSGRVFDFLDTPVDLRDKVPYRREFLDNYDPNVDSLLPTQLADSLYRTAHWENGPHHFYGAVTLMTEFITELCWSSSKLEGCNFTLAETASIMRLNEQLATASAEQSGDMRIVLNHKRALELIAFDAPRRVSFEFLLRLQGCLIDGLQPPALCGRVRNIVVQVTGTAYTPGGIPVQLEELLQQIAVKAAAIRNPVEAAFFLWVHIAYLQAFSDGNKRTGRLAANLPLLTGHCAPLSFGGVKAHDYAVAMLGVYERQDVSVAVDLFEWMYRRSMQKYPWMLAESGSRKDPRYSRFYRQLSPAMRAVVVDRKPAGTAASEQQVPVGDEAMFLEFLLDELAGLYEGNCRRHGLSQEQVTTWFDVGRPH
ncbi:Fic family protein [Roseateles chitinivorans]|uniref:Fic family protein n=1 Tax=Roseateles chitinivorans TaxID=2917965 RepID=UPI003D671FC1